MNIHTFAGIRTVFWPMLSLAIFACSAATQSFPPAHEATVGVLGGYLVDLEYRDSATGLPEVYSVDFDTLGQDAPLEFLKEGSTYKAHFWIAFGSLQINLQYGGAHFARGAKMVVIRGCSSASTLLSALKDRRPCTADDAEKSPIQWKEAEPIESLSPREQFEFYCAAYRFSGYERGDPMLPDHDNNARIDREQDIFVTKLASLIQTLQPPPAIPEAAHEAFIEGATFLKNAHNGNDLYHAQDKFDYAILYAPWWADAYYNDAIALEKESLYDNASAQLKRYLMFPLSESDARSGRDRIYAISAEKEGRKADEEEYMREVAAKYVNGGTRRVTEATSPDSWRPKSGIGIEGLYAYMAGGAGIDSGYFQNVFLMPSGRYISLLLEAQSFGNGTYSGDKILIADITDASNAQAYDYVFGTLDDRFEPPGGVTYRVSVSARGQDGVVSVTDIQSGAGFSVPLRDLYVARYWNVLNTSSSGYANGYATLGEAENYPYVAQAGRRSAYVSFFDSKLDAGHADPLSLTPLYVIALDQKDEPIGNTGYYIRWHGNTWKVEK